eukprot:5695716-Alexandrium_andersonii.AAC.1
MQQHSTHETSSICFRASPNPGDNLTEHECLSARTRARTQARNTENGTTPPAAEQAVEWTYQKILLRPT